MRGRRSVETRGKCCDSDDSKDGRFRTFSPVHADNNPSKPALTRLESPHFARKGLLPRSSRVPIVKGRRLRPLHATAATKEGDRRKSATTGASSAGWAAERQHEDAELHKWLERNDEAHARARPIVYAAAPSH